MGTIALKEVIRTIDQLVAMLNILKGQLQRMVESNKK